MKCVSSGFYYTWFGGHAWAAGELDSKYLKAGMWGSPWPTNWRPTTVFHCSVFLGIHFPVEIKQ